ncbi:NADH-quinone oxidoreductase subunit NuoE [Buchnera aphidicola (Taiwanaphis decaspermi)]|uniref:NADH-quinone oxidoreductase subunit NuoE n=1 Tax=Buchnera aphidicola TaxID=9 RepID=UPI0031B8AD5E
MYSKIKKNNHNLNEKEIKFIKNEKKKYLHSRSAIIEILKFIQKKRGWISKKNIIEISNILKISACDIEGVATFYSNIFRKPVGRNIIKYCDSVVCYINNYDLIVKKIYKILKIKKGETTNDDNFTLLPVCCLGKCDKGPVIMINNKIYSNVTTDSIIKIIEFYK